MATTDMRSPRNPFGVLDAPDPNGQDIDEFAAQVQRSDSSIDAKALVRNASRGDEPYRSIEGHWLSRWNGGGEPAMVGDTEDTWKPGTGELRVVGDRVYVLFDWADSARQALLDARRDGPVTLIGRYVNLGDPTITSPWRGRIVDNRRIDGRWSNGRLDFRR
jgi:hypothetical protein